MKCEICGKQEEVLRIIAYGLGPFGAQAFEDACDSCAQYAYDVAGADIIGVRLGRRWYDTD